MGTLSDALYSGLSSDLSCYAPPSCSSENSSDAMGYDEMTFKEAACYSLKKSILRKLKVANSHRHDSKALLKFLTVNYRCKNWKLELNSVRDQELFGEVRRAIYNFWNPEGLPLVSHESDILHYARCGPGAAVGSLGGDFYTKMFASRLTSTNRYLYMSYRDYIRTDDSWHNAELIRRAKFGSVDIVRGSRLSFVPKNDEISRTICIEPSLNMFFQLGLGAILDRRIEEMWGISFTSQPFKNRELARQGSVFDSLVTIDLESASDSLSCNMLRAVLPEDFYNLLGTLRSRYTMIPGLGHFELDMISTMGNGFTFPLQTMLFSAVVLAAFKLNQEVIRPLFPRGREWGNFGVFGDDIVVPRVIVDDVFRLLDILGFTINKDKTFVKGPFRESCGADYFRGRDIRGVYLKRLDTPQDLYVAINQLNLFSTKTGIALPKTVRVLLERVKFVPVPRWENDDAGIKVPFSMVRLPIDRHTQSTLYSRFVAEGKKIRILERSIWVPKRHKPRIYNPYGLWVSFLQRSVNAYSIGVRHDPVRYKRKLGIAPSWDALPTTHPLAGWFNWQRWNTAVYLNLFG
jgi:hypothetical protein